MHFKSYVAQILFFIGIFCANKVFAHENKLVYLRGIDPTIAQDIRYAGYHNFVGRPIKGYEAAECILTEKAAMALADVQSEVKRLGLSLKVYDCYRPQAAVSDFWVWSKNRRDQKMKAEFYPRVDKKDFFRLGYVSEMSGHTRGSTVDLTLVPLPLPPQARYEPGDSLVSCLAPSHSQYLDNSIDMGTTFDCMDPRSFPSARVNPRAFAHRMLLRDVMVKHGFTPYAKEWWHFTLRNEPYPHTYFNFPIKKVKFLYKSMRYSYL